MLEQPFRQTGSGTPPVQDQQMSQAQPIELLKEPMALSLYLDTGAFGSAW